MPVRGPSARFFLLKVTHILTKKRLVPVAKSWHQHSATKLLVPKLEPLTSVAMGGATAKILCHFDKT